MSADKNTVLLCSEPVGCALVVLFRLRLEIHRLLVPYENSTPNTLPGEPKRKWQATKSSILINLHFLYNAQ